MNSLVRVSLLLLAVVVATLPGVAVAKSFEPQFFVPKPNEPIKTIGLIQVPEPARYYLGEGASQARDGFMPLIANLLLDRFEKHEEYEIAGFSFPPVAQPRLISHLEAAGFKVIVIPVEREKPRLLESYDSLPTAGIDAYLDVAPSGVGYMGTYGFMSKKVGPHVSTYVRLVSAHTKEVRYQDFIEYGWGMTTEIGMQQLDAPEDHVFKKTKILKADLTNWRNSTTWFGKPPSISWLEDGIDVVMQAIVSGFSPRRYLPIEVPVVASDTPRYRIAIFPAGGCFVAAAGYGCGTVGRDETARLLRGHIQRDNALVLAYSHYDDALNEPRIKNRDRLWVGGRNLKEPDLDVVIGLARERGVDGVVMYWGGGRTAVYGSTAPAPIDLYLINVERRQVYRAKGTTKKSSVRKLTKRVFADFMKDRPQAMQAKAEKPTQPMAAKRSSASATTPLATTTPGTVSRSTPYRIGIFPCGGGNPTREQQVALVLQTNIQRDRGLTVAYSYYDDALNEPPIKNRDRLWVGGQVKKKPNAEVVYRLARERGLDGVVMCWVRRVANYNANWRPIDLYLVDVAQRKVYRQKGTTKKSDVDKLTRKLFAQFLAWRPQAQAKKKNE